MRKDIMNNRQVKNVIEQIEIKRNELDRKAKKFGLNDYENTQLISVEMDELINEYFEIISSLSNRKYNIIN